MVLENSRPSENVVEDELIVDDFNYSGILLSLRGSVYDMSTIRFDQFKQQDEDPMKGNIEFEREYSLSTESGVGDTTTALDTMEVFKIIVPELYTTDFAEQSEQLLNVYGENQINSFFRRQLLRPIERQVASRLNIESFKIDYNLGKAVLKGVSEFTDFENLGSEQNILGLSFSKLLTDQLFVNFRTNLDLRTSQVEGNNSETQSELELRYYLLNDLFVNVINLQQEGREDETKFSLKFRYEY